MFEQATFQTCIVVLGSMVTAICALLYFRAVRLERPPVGVFSPRDIVFLMTFIILLPALYLVLPSVVLTGFLVLTFASALYLALRPFMLRRYIWLVIGVVLAGNIYVTETMLGTQQGLQLYWVLNSVVALIAAVGVSNLYVQGGMRLSHIAGFALALACYDAFFGLVVPITQKLADRFEGQPLDPSIGFAWGMYNANIGLGDLLVYGLFTIAAYKGFGKRGVIASFIIIPIFGAILPAVAPLIITAFVRQNIGIVIPAQTFFGPVAFLTYLWLKRHSAERTIGQWISEQDAAGHEPIRVVRRTSTRPVPVQNVQPQPQPIPVAAISSAAEVGVSQAG